jgi:GNAT superfamily N-acetyltransferase
MALSVRAFEPADRGACERIFQAMQGLVFAEYSHSANEPEDFETVTAGEELWVAEGAGRAIIGFVSIWRPARFIHHLYVDPAWQRRGVGRALLSRAIAVCQGGGGKAELKCGEANRAAQSFYIAAGLRPVGWGWAPSGPWIRYRG